MKMTAEHFGDPFLRIGVLLNETDPLVVHIVRRKAGLLRHFLNDLRIIAGDAQLFRYLFADGASAAAKRAADGDNSVFYAFRTPSTFNSR